MNEKASPHALSGVFEKLISDSRYLENLDWGKPRRGHPEGTVRAHINELEHNLSAMRSFVNEDEYWKLRILIHVHDSFKAGSKRGVSITDPNSHASLATDFLRAYHDDLDLLNMVQYHDEPYALWRQARNTGNCSQRRLHALIARIDDWNLFLMFIAIDGVTKGKSSAPLYWSASTIGSRVGLASDMTRYVDQLVQCLGVG